MSETTLSILPKLRSGIKYIDIKKIKKLRLQGLSCQQIATQLGCSKTNIVNRLQGISFDKDEIEHAQKNLVGLNLADMLRYRSFITDAKLKKASAPDLSKMASFSFNQYRLENDQSTSNLEVHEMIDYYHILKAKIAQRTNNDDDKTIDIVNNPTD